MKSSSKARKESEIKYISQDNEKSGEEINLTVSTDIESSGKGIVRIY